MTVIKISPLPSHEAEPHPASLERKWYQVKNCDTGQSAHRQIPTIPSTSLKELQWYIEDYAELDPFDSARASNALSALNAYGKDLVSSLDLAALIPPSRLNESLVIQIQEPDVVRNFWELLERPELWRPAYRPASVIVLRNVPCADNLSQHDFSTARAFFTNRLRVLIVTARSSSKEDVAPRLVSRLIVEANERCEDPIEVEIVRPSTFEALKAQLKADYFDIVHFDMHGIEDPATGAVFLQFFKHENALRRLDLQPDYRTAAEVGALLRERNVDQVVLNACRSAYGSSLETNIAHAFVHAGVSVVLAMSFTIGDGSVEIFIKALYKGMVEHGLNLEAAACLARRAMLRNPNRTSKMGFEVVVADSIVPVLYMDSSMDRSLPKQLPELYGLEEKQDLRRLFPYGRETDILHLESALLIGNMPVLLTGQAGIGKTTLLKHLRGWWMKTGLIKDAIHIQLSSDSFDADALYARLQGYFTGVKSPVSQEKLLAHLTQHRCLIILDRLEAVSRTRKYGAFLKFVKFLGKTNALVIIASRRLEKWLGSATIAYQLHGLRTIPGAQVVRGILRGAQHLFNVGNYKSEEDFHYLEQIVSLTTGNPLVLRLLTQDGLCLLKSPKEYYLGMLSGEPTMLNRREAEDVESLRSVLQCEEIVDQLMPTRWGDGFTPTVFACFQQLLPVTDLGKFVVLWSLASRKEFVGTGTMQEKAKAGLNMMETLGLNLHLEDATEDMKMMMEVMKLAAASTEKQLSYPKMDLASIIVSYEEVDFPEIPIVDRIVETGCTKFVSMMKDGGFLEEMSMDALSVEHTESSRAKRYMALHPLIPFILRAQPGYGENLLKIAQSSKEAFVHYYCWRSKNWPWTKIYYNPAWTQHRDELHMEFVNFVTAAMIGLGNKHQDELQLACLFRFATVLQRGVLKDPGRLRLVAIVWELALNLLLAEIDTLLKARNEKKPATLLTSLESAVGGWISWIQQPPEPQSDGEAEADVAIFCLRAMAMIFTLNLAQHFHRLRSPKQAAYVKTGKKLIHDSKKSLPHSLTPEAKERMQRSFAHCELGLRNITDTRDRTTLPQLFQERKAYHEYLISDQEGEAYPEAQQSWEDIPFSIVSLSAQFAHMISIHQKIRQAIREEKWKEAEKLVDGAFVQEINVASNDATNKAELLEFRAEIAEGQGQWGNALEFLTEAWKLADEASGEVSIPVQERVKREKRKKRLERRRREGGRVA